MIKPVLWFNVMEMCHKIKNLGYNLRVCLNLTKAYETSAPSSMMNKIFDRLIDLGVDQVTFRKLYTSSIQSPINNYILENGLSPTTFDGFTQFIQRYGTALEILPFGARKYSYRGISTVLDDDCMAYQPSQAIRYLILRENCKLYSRWDNKGSLIF